VSKADDYVTKSAFSLVAREEAKSRLGSYAPHKLTTPEGKQQMEAFCAGARFAQEHFAKEQKMNEQDLDAAEQFASQIPDETTVPAWVATTDGF
jgi:hypothetical protein